MIQANRKAKTKAIVVITTTETKKQANQLARLILEEHLAACIQIDLITSLYRWHGGMMKEKEFRLMIKSSQSQYENLESLILKNHPYDNPEVIALAVHKGALKYLDWMKECTQGKEPKK